MTLKRKILISISSILGIVLVLFVVLVVHIASAKPVVYDNATMQVSRIDFKEPIDSAKAKEIHRNLKTISGVKNDRFNIEKGILVYFHDNRITNSQKVFDALIAKGNYKAERFVVSEAVGNKQVCPVMKEDSFSYHFSKGVQRIFN